MDYNATYKWKGIELYKYTVQSTPQYDTAAEYPPNDQFFQFKYSGLANLTNCSAGLPLFVSLPFFLGGDDVLIANAMKMNLRAPNRSTDLPFIDVEPMTGAIFRANKSLQINTMIHSIPWIENDTIYSEAYRRLPDDIVVPMIELSECEELTESQAASFRSQVVDTYLYAHILEIVGYVSCGLLFVFGLISTFLYGRSYAQKRNDQTSKINIDEQLLFEHRHHSVPN